MSARLPRINILPGLLLPILLGVIEWAESHIDMSLDVTAPTADMLKLEPYQKEPIRAQFEQGTTEIVGMAPPQTGKSILWRVAVLYRMAMDNTGPGWIMYESTPKAESINGEQIRPFVEGIAAVFRKFRKGTRSMLADKYKLKDGIVEFGGAGTPPTSRPAKFAVGDELPTWPGTHETKMKTIGNLRDRLRRFTRDAWCCLVIVGSPQGENDPVGDLFEESTREHWHLRCTACKKLTMASHHIGNLQFRVSADNMPIRTSIRLECPDCGYAHKEKQAQRMNDAGGYIARRRHPFRRGFQWGALASPSSYTWEEIAIRRLAANSKAPQSVLIDYAKSILGMPYRPRSLTADREAALRDRSAPLPDPGRICLLLFSADTQDTGFYWVVRGYTVIGESYPVDYGFAETFDKLQDAWDADYCGHQCAMGVIDEGGHRGKKVQEFVYENEGLYTWKGTTQGTGRYKLTELDKSQDRLELLRISGNPYTYQAALLHEMYVRTKREINAAGEFLPTPFYLYFPQDPTDDYLEQMNSFVPNKKKRNGHRYENWEHGDRPDHYFDVEKQHMCLIEHVENLYTKGEARGIWINDLLPVAEWMTPPPAKGPPPEPEGEYTA